MIDAGSGTIFTSAGWRNRFTGYAHVMGLRIACFVLCALALAACGGGGSKSSSSTASVNGNAPPGGATLAEVLGLPKNTKQIDTPDVLAISGADFSSGGTTRVPVGLLHKDGSQFIADGNKIQIWLAPSGASRAIGPFEATYQPIAGPGIKLAPQDIKGVFVTHVKVPAAGSYYIAAKYTANGKESTASGGITFNNSESTPAVGTPAPPSVTPTLKSVGGNAAKITTADPPDTSLLQYSVADTLKAKKPFVVVFATPKFCTSRLCGPTVQIVQDVQKRMKDTPMRFIHLEIYQGNDPNNAPDSWVTEWGLPTEPWVFVVGADGNVKAKFEGALSIPELETAARAALT
jgi:hypothetical protein